MSRRGAMVRFESAEGCVFVREVGEGPPLLLINGLGAHSAMWEPLERTLSAFRIIEFDLPGAGRSDVPRRPISVPRLAKLATEVLDHFDVDQADVLGYSMGGIVTQQLLADFPDRVRRAVLVATSPGVGAVHGDIVALVNLMTPIRYLSPTLYAKSIGSLAGGRARHDKAWVAEQGVLRLKHAPKLWGYVGQMASMTGWSGLPLLRRIENPVLVLTGDDDPLTPVANGMMLAHLLPQGRLLVLRGEGHLLVLDADSPSHDAICGFLMAETLEDSGVWQDALEIDAEELRIGMASAGWQLPQWSLLAARARRRWLRPDRSAAA